MPMNDETSSSSWSDPDDAPPWTAETFERAELRDGDKVVRSATGTLTKRGRPRVDHPKRQISLRLDGAVIDRLRETGSGWQGRVNEILKRAVGL